MEAYQQYTCTLLWSMAHANVPCCNAGARLLSSRAQSATVSGFPEIPSVCPAPLRGCQRRPAAAPESANVDSGGATYTFCGVTAAWPVAKSPSARVRRVRLTGRGVRVAGIVPTAICAHDAGRHVRVGPADLAGKGNRRLGKDPRNQAGKSA